jgi:hypothetical protein
LTFLCLHHSSQYIPTIFKLVLTFSSIYINTPPQDGPKIFVMPILLHTNSFSLGSRPFVKQSTSLLTYEEWWSQEGQPHPKIPQTSTNFNYKLQSRKMVHKNWN